ncbi:MAG: hypothetical protein JXR40_12805 [Pontiellaceae bacterium]|nr:hypothetical protein [Pontiellaceae bacterium]
MKLIKAGFFLVVISFMSVEISRGAEQDLFSQALRAYDTNHTALVSQIVTNNAVSLSFLKERSQSTNIMEAVLASYLSDCFTNSLEVAKYEQELDEAIAFVSPYHVNRLGLCIGPSKRVAASVGKDAVPFLGEVVLFGLNEKPPKGLLFGMNEQAPPQQWRSLSLRRTIAILVLGEIDDPRTTDILCQCLDCRYFDDREDNPTAYALKNKGDVATNALTRVIAVEKDPGKRLVAANALALLKDQRAGLLLVSILQNKGDDKFAFSSRVRRVARILRDHPYPEALQALKEVQGISDSFADQLVREAITRIEQSLKKGTDQTTKNGIRSTSH